MVYKYKNLDLEKIYLENTYDELNQVKITQFIESTLNEIKSALKKEKIDAQVMLGGSSAKGTFVKGSFDCDVFIRFNYEKYSRENSNLANLLESALKHLDYKYEKLYGSRDYFKFTKDNIDFEIVPVLNIKSIEYMMNLTDASPLHVKWVLKQLKNKPMIKRDVILTKLFLKANKLYGAESYISGFSGHVTDILITHYGDFITLLENALHWEDNFQIIDVEKHYKEDPKKILNKSKLTPLIIIDPIDKTRNAGAAISKEVIMKFKKAAKEFLENPNENSFIRKLIQVEDVKSEFNERKKEYLIILKISPIKNKKDVMGAKILKFVDTLNYEFNKNEFLVNKYDWEWDGEGDALAWFFIDYEKLSPFIIHQGPEVDNIVHVEMFKLKYKETTVRDGRITTVIRRKFVDPRDIVTFVKSDEKWIKSIYNVEITNYLKKTK